MTATKNEFEFTLPMGYRDRSGALHKTGVMRRASSDDKSVPRKDPRVRNNDEFLSVLLLARVVVRIGAVEAIDARIIEELSAVDFAFLEALYQHVNEPSRSPGG